MYFAMFISLNASNCTELSTEIKKKRECNDPMQKYKNVREKTQNKGKESENSYQKLKISQ